ncbi:MAG: ABC transporter permease [Oscillospiraceae bacterium]|nr:ABC transporter permease [Oscillospiraceae bacterium]
MAAVYKRELRGFFTTMTGYVYTAFMLALGGIYFTVYNLRGGYAEFGITLTQMTVLLLVGAPLLTMRMLGDERRQKTDQLLFTSPAGIGGIVAGKYLAVLTLYALPLLGYCFFPLILTRYAQVSLPLAYASLLGYFLAGAAALAVGMLVSALCENPLVSAVAAFFILLLCNCAPWLTAKASQSGFYAVLVMGGIVIVAGILCGLATRSPIFGLAVFTVGILALITVYLIDTGLVSAAMAGILGAVSLFSPLVDFVSGVFDLNALVYYFTAIALLLLFTAQAAERRRWQ